MPILCLHHYQKLNVSNKCLSHLRYQNAVIQTRLLAPTLGGTRKLKTGQIEFPPVSAGKTRQHKHNEQTPKTRIGQKVACTAARIMASQPPPHDFRQHYLQGFNTALTLSGIDPRIEPNQISHITIECTSKTQKVPPALRWQQVNETNASLFDADAAARIMSSPSPPPRFSTAAQSASVLPNHSTVENKIAIAETGY